MSAYKPPEHEYKTLGELRDAIAAGVLTGKLWIDNDSVHFTTDDDDDDRWYIFEMHPDELIEQALDLLGIPHEHV